VVLVVAALGLALSCAARRFLQNQWNNKKVSITLTIMTLGE
jgi:hypothetical protein